MPSPFLPTLIPTLFDYAAGDTFRRLPGIDGAVEPAPNPSGVEVCSAPAFGLPPSAGEATGIEHWWLKDGVFEAGLGPNDATRDPLDTTITDQSGSSATRDGVTCVPLADAFPERADVDPACLRDALEPRELDYGTYGVDGICKDAVDDVLLWCDPSEQFVGPTR